VQKFPSKSPRNYGCLRAWPLWRWTTGGAQVPQIKIWSEDTNVDPWKFLPVRAFVHMVLLYNVTLPCPPSLTLPSNCKGVRSQSSGIRTLYVLSGRGVDHGGWGVVTTLKIYRRGQRLRICFEPPKMSHFFHSKLSLDNSPCKFQIMKDERHVPKMEGKTSFSRHLKQFDDLTWLTLTPSLILRQICAIALWHSVPTPELCNVWMLLTIRTVYSDSCENAVQNIRSTLLHWTRDSQDFSHSRTLVQF